MTRMERNRTSKKENNQDLINLKDINQKDPLDIMNYVAQEYYKENMEPFFAILHPRILFMSIGKGQVVEGLDNLKKAYETGLAHSIPSVQYEIVSFNSKKQNVTGMICNTMMQMQVISFYPNGTVREVNQRITITWQRSKKLEFPSGDIRSGWFALQIHVSVGIDAPKAEENINHLAPNIVIEPPKYTHEDGKLVIPESNRSQYFVKLHQIVRVRAKDLHCYVYMQDGEVIETRKSLMDFEKELEGKGFVRIHKSHLVNADYVKAIKNYKVTMLDGELLPIPKEKYREIKDKIMK